MTSSNGFFDERTKFMVATLVFVFVWITSNSFLCWGWVSAAILAFGVWIVMLSYGLVKKDQLVLSFLALATVAGFVELAADNWLVNGIEKLFYEKDEPQIVASPIYMPFGWAVILTQIGFIGWKLIDRWSLIKASLFTGLIGGLLIPFYEHCAKGACWWVYHDWNHEWWNTPYFIIMGEALLMLIIPYAMSKAATHKWSDIIIWGVISGLWIWASYYIGFVVVG